MQQAFAMNVSRGNKSIEICEEMNH